MDDRRFDALVRALASGGSRRQMMKGLFGLAGGALAGATLRPAGAARRPTPTPKPVRCPGSQTWDGDACACPGDTTQCGAECCPSNAQCCDNACCYGYCYGEELCCEDPHIFCELTGECCGFGQICCGALGCVESELVECCVDQDCGANAYCDGEGQCHCVEDARDCGAGCVIAECCDDDDCAEGEICIDGTCVSSCQPDCAGLCGGESDGCGGTCSVCPGGQECRFGACFTPCDYLASNSCCDDCYCDPQRVCSSGQILQPGACDTFTCPEGYVCVVGELGATNRCLLPCDCGA